MDIFDAAACCVVRQLYKLINIQGKIIEITRVQFLLTIFMMSSSDYRCNKIKNMQLL